MTIISAEDFDPYPGEFLKDTLEDQDPEVQPDSRARLSGK